MSYLWNKIQKTITFSYEINCIFEVADYNINMKETIIRTLTWSNTFWLDNDASVTKADS